MYLPPYIRDNHGIAFPTNPFERELFYRDDLHQLFYWNGTAWINAGGLGPIGVKNPPIDTDKELYLDSTAGDAPVTSTWLQIKAFLETYFDTVYDAIGSAAAALAAALDALAAHIDNTAAGIHGSSVAAVIDTLIHRDGAGRAQIANPAVAAEIDNMGARDAAIAVEAAARAAADAAEAAARIAADNAEAAARAAADAAHAALTAVGIHGSAVLATPNLLVHRDAAGRSQIVNPAVAAEIDNMGARNAAIAAAIAAANFIGLTDTPSSYEGQAGKLPRVNSDEDALEFIGPALLPELVRQSNFIMIPTVAGWEEVKTGAGNVRQEVMRQVVEILDVNAGSALARTKAFGFNIGDSSGRMNWDKRLFIIFNYDIYKTEAGLTRRMQVKESGSLGQLAELGVGFQAVDLAMTGESYGIARGTVSLGNIEPADGYYKGMQVVIELEPASPAVRFYINGSLKGSITNSSYIPSGIGTAIPWFVHSIDRSAGGLASVLSYFMLSKIWQEA